MFNSLIRIYFPTVAIMKARLERYLNRLLMLQKIKELSVHTPTHRGAHLLSQTGQ